MVIEGKMSTMSSPLYPTSPTEEKEGYEGGYLKREDGSLRMDDDSEDEYIDVDDSLLNNRYNGDVNDAVDGKDIASSGEESSVKSPDSTKKNSEKKVYRCQHCKYVTDRKNNLKRHVVTMHEQCQKTLECCDVVFKNKVLQTFQASLRDHVLSCHRNGYDCRICGRNFCRKALLKRHVTVHSGQKDYICSVCGYATSHKSNLDRHKRRHGPKYPMDGCKYKIPDSTEMDAVKALSPSSLSNSPSPLPKCHAFSIERLVGDDYHPRRRLYNEITSPTLSLFSVQPMYQEPKDTSQKLPLKKRHLNARYLFTKRLICTHNSDNSDQYKSSQNNNLVNETNSCFIKEQKDNSSQLVLHKNSSNERGNSLQNNKGLLVSSKRLVPALYQCKVCNITFGNQIEMGYHFKEIKHEEWMPSPQRPLTIEARHKDTRYIY